MQIIVKVENGFRNFDEISLNPLFLAKSYSVVSKHIRYIIIRTLFNYSKPSFGEASNLPNK